MNELEFFTLRFSFILVFLSKGFCVGAHHCLIMLEPLQLILALTLI